MKTEALHLKEFYPFLGHDACDPVLTMYLPYNMPEMHQENIKRPCILICPGGAYAMCSQRESEPVALHYLTAGFNVFVLHYSPCPQRDPRQRLEVAAALELLYAHAEDWHCDTSRIVLLGFSAGGHLAAYYCNTYDAPAIRQIFPDSKPVRATILGYPVITADPAWTHQPSIEHLLGYYPTDEAGLAAVSCDRLVRPDTPPAFLWHTSTDGSVPVMNSLLYAEALTRRHIPFEMHVYPCGGHGLATADEHTCSEAELYGCTGRAHRWLTESCHWLAWILH